MKTHPTVMNGKIPLTLEFLSPAMRPIQTTQDIAGFWQGSWADVQRELRGRYPRHFWPDDPANAPATTRTKARMDKRLNCRDGCLSVYRCRIKSRGE